MHSSISPKYQVTIPKEVRDKFPQIKPGKIVRIYEVDGKIILEPKLTVEEAIKLFPKSKISAKGKTIDEIRDLAFKKAKKNEDLPRY